MESLFHSHTHTQHMDLKRDMSGMHKRQESGGSGNVTLVDGPLFERYQFLSPGSSLPNPHPLLNLLSPFPYLSFTVARSISAGVRAYC